MRLLVTLDAIRLLPQLPRFEREFAASFSLFFLHSLRMDVCRSRCSRFVIQTGNARRQTVGSRSR